MNKAVSRKSRTNVFQVIESIYALQKDLRTFELPRPVVAQILPEFLAALWY
jgi:hypothetical protein